MEAAPSKRFLGLTILFSLTSDYERKLKKELWLWHKNMGLSMEEIYRMPVRDRRYFISLHNKLVKEETEKMRQMRHK